MNPEDDEPVHGVIKTKLTELIEHQISKPGWHGRLEKLGPGSTEDERLAVFQAVRDSGVVTEDAGLYLVSWQVDQMADEDSDPVLRDLSARLEVIGEALDRDVEGSIVKDVVDVHRNVLEQYYEAQNEFFAKSLDQHGEHDIATLFRTDRAEFERRQEEGRLFFFGEPGAVNSRDPAWLDLLLDAVEQAIDADSPMGPLALLYLLDDDFWDVDIYPTSLELVGGAEDGAIVTPFFSLDIDKLCSGFEHIEEIRWSAQGTAVESRPFVSIEGTFDGHEVYLRVLAEGPEGEKPGAKLPIERDRRS